MSEDIKIMNLYKSKPSYPYDFKVDRSTPLGNPYSLMEGYTRDTACDLYAQDFDEILTNENSKAYYDKLIEAYRTHRKLRLFCWCAPLRCHSEYIRKRILLEVSNG